jgi:hypothetical protein
MSFTWRSQTSYTWIYKPCPTCKKGSRHKTQFDISIGKFKTFAQCGDQNLQIKLEMDSKERKAQRGNM